MTLAITSIQCWSLQDRFTLGVPRLRTGTSAIPGGFPVPPSAAQPLHCTWQPWVQLIIVSAFIKSQECGTTIDLFTLPRSSIKKISKSYTLSKYIARETNCILCFSAKGYSIWAFEWLALLCSYVHTTHPGSNRDASSISVIFMAFSLRLIWHSAWGNLTVWLILTDIISYF